MGMGEAVKVAIGVVVIALWVWGVLHAFTLQGFQTLGVILVSLAALVAVWVVGLAVLYVIGLATYKPGDK